MKRLFSFLMVALMLVLVNQVMAWELPKNAFGPQKMSVGNGAVDNGENIFAAMPLSYGNYGTQTQWGLGFCYAVGLFNVKPGEGTNVQVSPQLFVAAGASANVGDFINSKGNSPIPIDWDLFLGLPAMQGIPQLTIGISGKIGDSNRVITFGGAVPLEIFDGALIHKF